MERLATQLATRHRLTWAALLLIVLVSAALVLLAPAEATIGQGIRIVYIHVALIWSGMLLLLLAGLLGLWVLFAAPTSLAQWMHIVALVGASFFAAGVITSLAAEIVNWGGIAWREPRTSANLNLMALAILVQVLISWLPRVRWRGALNALLAAAVIWTTVTTEVQLHPDNAVGDATSWAIQLAFYSLTLLCLLAAAWLILALRGRQTAARREAAI